MKESSQVRSLVAFSDALFLQINTRIDMVVHYKIWDDVGLKIGFWRSPMCNSIHDTLRIAIVENT